MDDARLTVASRNNQLTSATNFRFVRYRPLTRLTALLTLAGILCSLTGCSIFVLAGKMVFGDPKIACASTAITGVDLVKEKKTVLVICNVAESIEADYPALNLDLIDGISRRLKRAAVSTIDQDDVTTWLDDNGGIFGDPSESASELIREFDVDYVIHIDVDRLTYKEENSPTLFRGRCDARIQVFSAEQIGGSKQSVEVFAYDFASVYPQHYPVSSDRQSGTMFRQKYVDNVSTQFTQMFYNHRLSEEIE